jgi:hypothetical protein
MPSVEQLIDLPVERARAKHEHRQPKCRERNDRGSEAELGGVELGR